MEYPDYSLYPGLTEGTAYGFLTRGCPRGCGFCHVGGKEGRASRKVAGLSEFWRGQKNVVIMDPNILACPERRDLLEQLVASRAYVDFNQGLDIRLVDKDVADLLAMLQRSVAIIMMEAGTPPAMVEIALLRSMETGLDLAVKDRSGK